MQNSTFKNVRLIPAAAVIIIITAVLAGCTSLKTDYKAVPYGAIPGDCLFYFTVDPEIIPSTELDKNVKSLLGRTALITGGYSKGEYYLLFRGKYPDTFAEKRISESSGWGKSGTAEYYFNRQSNTAVFFARNNYIFVTNYMNMITEDKPMNRIYSNYGSGNYPDVFDYFALQDKEYLFQLYSEKGSDLVSLFPEKSLQSVELADFSIRLRDGLPGGIKGKYFLESSMRFVSEKEARKYSPALKLVLYSLVRDNESGFSVKDDKKMSVKLDNSMIMVSDILVSDKVTERIFNKILTGQVF